MIYGAQSHLKFSNNFSRESNCFAIILRLSTWHKASPNAEVGKHRPRQRVTPNEEHKEGRLRHCQLAFQRIRNDIVSVKRVQGIRETDIDKCKFAAAINHFSSPVICNECISNGCTNARNGSDEGEYLAPMRPQRHRLVEAIVDQNRNFRHHNKVAECQIQHEQIGRCS